MGAFIIKSETFKIKEIKIVGAKSVSELEIKEFLIKNQLQKTLANYLGYAHILLWRNGEFTMDNPKIKKASLAVNLGRREVIVTIVENNKILIWCEENGICFWLNEDGYAVEEAPIVEGQLVDAVINRSSKKASLGIQALTRRDFEALRNIISLIKEAGLLTKEIAFNENSDVVVWPALGPKIYFNPAINSNFALPVIEKLRKTGEFKKLSQLDFRVENKAYYR